MKHTPAASSATESDQPWHAGRLGIRGKLALGLVLGAVCTLLVGVVGWISFQRVVHTQETILAETLPGAEDMHALVRGNARLAALAPQLNKATDTTEVALLRARLGDELEQMRRRIAAFHNPHVEASLTADLRRTYADLSDTLIDMTQAVIIRLTLAAERQAQLSRYRGDIRTLSELADIQADNATAHLVSVLTAWQLDPPGPASEATLNKLIDIDLDHLERMQEMRLAVHMLSARLEHLNEYDDTERLAQGRASYLDDLALLQRRLRNVQNPAERSDGQRLSTRLSAMVHDDGAFALRARELALAGRTDTLQRTVGQLTTRLDEQAGELILRSGGMLASAVSNARQAVSSGLIAFGLTAAILMLFSAVVLWQTLRRHLFSRLKRLEDATLALASGRRDVAIDTRGTDELASLAHALARFRDNALERDLLASTLDRERGNLEQEVAQRTAQLRGANAALATEMAGHALAREQAEHANRAKTAFLGVISHELRTPMSGVLGTLELLEDTPLHHDQRELAGQIRTAATLLMETLEDMLNYAQYEVSRPTIDQSQFRLPDLIADLFAVQGVRAHEKGLALTENIAADVPVNLTGDRRKLAQILLNLIGNAIKFTDEGMVEILVEVVQRDADKGILSFSVIDSGVGIDPHQQASVFEPFVQADSGKRLQHGTGLGLSVCRRLVLAMGGDIRLQSQPGAGTTVTFTLPFGIVSPLAALPPATVAPAAGIPMRAPSLTILVVEDDDATRMVATRFLTSRGHRVQAAASAAAALSLFTQHAIDVALIDLNLPDANGRDVMARLRALPGHDGLPVVLMSAHADDTPEVRLARSGDNLYLPKPFQRDQLLQAIDQAMAGAAWGDLAFLRDEYDALGLPALREITDLFAEQANASAQALEHAVQSDDMPACKRHAHRLRGSAASVGLSRLSAQAAALERQTGQPMQDSNAWKQAAGQLARDIPRANTWLLQTLDTLAAQRAIVPGAGVQDTVTGIGAAGVATPDDASKWPTDRR